MAVRLREADLARDEATLVGLTETYLGATEKHRFRWLYRDGPFGPARVWLAFDDLSHTPFGMAALFPRRGYIQGEEVLGCVLGDFCVSEPYRSLGPAIRLQRACLEMVKSGEFDFSYDFPSAAMLGVYRYMGLTPTDESVRMVRLLRTEGQVRKKVSSPALASALAKAADFALSLKDRDVPADKRLQYELDPGPCSLEYQRLAERMASSLGSCVLRSPEYLNWRYHKHPWCRYEFLTCRRDGELQAYCVFTCEEDRTQVVDLFGISDEAVLTGMVRRLARLVRDRGHSALSICVLASDPRMKTLRKLGFHARESTPVIAFGNKLTNGGSRLLLMNGDRES